MIDPLSYHTTRHILWLSAFISLSINPFSQLHAQNQYSYTQLYPSKRSVIPSYSTFNTFNYPHHLVLSTHTSLALPTLDHSSIIQLPPPLLSLQLPYFTHTTFNHITNIEHQHLDYIWVVLLGPLQETGRETGTDQVSSLELCSDTTAKS